MATLIDAGILGHFGSIFVVLLLFAIIFGILEVTSPFGKDGKRGLHAVIAFAIGLLFLVSGTATGIVKTMVPWFIIIIVFIFFLLLMFRMFGVTDGDFRKVVEDASVFPWIIIFATLVVIGALSAAFGQNLLNQGEGSTPGTTVVGDGTVVTQDGTLPVGDYGTKSTSTPNFGVNVMNTLRNPKVLGMVFIFLTGAFMMIFLTKPVTIK